MRPISFALALAILTIAFVAADDDPCGPTGSACTCCSDECSTEDNPDDCYYSECAEICEDDDPCDLPDYNCDCCSEECEYDASEEDCYLENCRDICNAEESSKSKAGRKLKAGRGRRKREESSGSIAGRDVGNRVEGWQSRKLWYFT